MNAEDKAIVASPSAAQEAANVWLLPGWLDSDAAHWQSRWEHLHGHRRVTQSDWVWPKRGDWMARLDEVLLSAPEPAVLVAHSLGCQLVAAWAAHSRLTAQVRAALLVAPPDVEREDMPPNLHSWRPIMSRALPFAALAVTSDDDPYCKPERALSMTQAWGASVVQLLNRGHLNGESGLGDWPEGHRMLQRLMHDAGVVPHAAPPL